VANRAAYDCGHTHEPSRSAPQHVGSATHGHPAQGRRAGRKHTALRLPRSPDSGPSGFSRV
jgi:hypothetical protein